MMRIHQNNPQEEGEDFAPTYASQEPIIRICNGRVVKSTRHSNLDFKLTLCELPFDSFQVP